MSLIPVNRLLSGLRALGESTRLRLLALLKEGELNVKDLTRILGQSQPRISRHLKLLAEAGLVQRYQEGSWVYFRLADGTDFAELVGQILSQVDMDDQTLKRDRARANAVKQERARTAQKYFREHAAEWDRIRSLHVAENDVENMMLKIAGPGPFGNLVDCGTGTGRILELFSDRIDKGQGFDINHDMLSYARANLSRGGYRHCQVRYGDLFNLPLDDKVADLVIVHQVLHFLESPAAAIVEAARVMKPGAKFLIVDFANHDLEFVRDELAHQRLGFEDKLVQQWITEAGLEPGLHKMLKPPKNLGREKLTVSLWVARKEPVDSEVSSTDNHQLLETDTL